MAFPATADAQSNADVVAQADDAFGTRIGIERIGLYNESQVRGFSLNQAANYQIDEVYVATLATPVNPILSGVTIKVGWNALQSDLPAPSGIVAYSIASPIDGARSYVEAGLLERQSPYAFGTASTKSESGTWGAGIGFQALPYSQRVDGARSRQFSGGGIVEWRPNKDTNVKAFISGSDSESPGDWGFLASEPALPPSPSYPMRFAAEGTRTEIEQYLVGVTGHTKTHAWDIRGGVFYSRLDLNPVDVTLIPLDRFGRGRALAILSHRGTSHAVSGEIKVGYDIDDRSRVFAAVRGRDTTYHTPRATAVDVGPVSIDDGGSSPVPASDMAEPRTLDVIRQAEVALGFERRLTDALLVRGAVRNVHYEKTVTPPGRPPTSQSDHAWLFSGEAIFALSERTTAFATYTSGLEESGSAPVTATNPFAALPAVTARQVELGLHTKLRPKLSFIASVFQITKPTPGFDAAGAYRLINEETHEGVELSLTGEIGKGLSAVLGAALFDPKLEGQLVDAGLAADRPVGVSGIVAVASLSYEIPSLAGLSIDGQVSYTGQRLVHASGDLEAPGFALVNIGGRYGFMLGNQNAVVRVLVSNFLNEDAWQAASSQIIQRTPPRAARLTLSLRY